MAFSQNGQTAFVTDREKTDPAARVAPVDMALANKPAEEVVQKYAAAIDNAPAMMASDSQTQEQQRKQSGPSMA